MKVITAPKLSIIIPTYNWSSVLPFSIGSALRQTFSDLEVLVVGDGCTDDSEAVVKSIRDNRVRWINLPANSGHQSAPNNEGLKQARGELIAYLGHDDLWLPHHLSCLVARIEEGFDFVYGLTGMVDFESPEILPMPERFKYERALWVPPSSVVHRREITARVGGWRHYSELVEDPEVELWTRAYDAGFRFDFVPRFTVVKFAASSRKDSYIKRSCVEQTEWTRRIEHEPALEATSLVKMLSAAMESKPSQRHVQYRDLLRSFAAETGARVARRLSPSPPDHPPTEGETVTKRRKFKGLNG